MSVAVVPVDATPITCVGKNAPAAIPLNNTEDPELQPELLFVAFQGT